jgi:hypothetical protein
MKMAHEVETWFGWLLAAGVAMACNTNASSTEGTDSSSHWLGICETRDDCGTALDCYCGLCTRICEQASNCSELDENAICSASHASCEQGAPSICTRAEEPDASTLPGVSVSEPLDSGALVGGNDPTEDPSTTNSSSSADGAPANDLSARPAGDAGSSVADESTPPAADAALPTPVGDEGATSEGGVGSAFSCHDSTECAPSELCRGPYEACDVESCMPTEDCQSDADCRAEAPAEDLACQSDGHCAPKSCDVEPCSANFTCTPVSTTNTDPQTFYYCTPTSCTADGDCEQGSVCVAWSGGTSRYCANVLGQCSADPGAG